jgi:hypothetical protein
LPVCVGVCACVSVFFCANTHKHATQ